jgi:hypothetical protein
MNQETRRAVAYIAARLAGQRDSGVVYDYDARRHFNFSGHVEPGNIQVYDYSCRCHISGTQQSLYHFGNRRHLTIDPRGANFTGYDYASRRFYSGHVAGALVSIYDHGTGRHHNYSV